MTDKTKAGIVARKSGVNYGGEHYPKDAAIKLPESQFNDWLGAGIVREGKATETKDAVAISNERAPVDAGEAEAPKTI